MITIRNVCADTHYVMYLESIANRETHKSCIDGEVDVVTIVTLDGSKESCEEYHQITHKLKANR